MTKSLLSSILLISVVNATEILNPQLPIESNTRDSGWYAGAGIGGFNWGGSLESTVSSSRSADKTITYNGDVLDMPMLFKVGYITESENRVEFYYKNDSFEQDESGAPELFKSNTFGINYQWGISSLSSKEMLPYFRLGLGFGSSSSSLSEGSELFDGGTVVELDLGVGVNYQVMPNFDISAGIYRRATVNAVENIENTDVKVLTGIATNGIEIGGAYHF